jgi:hypothetical protein
MLHYSSISEMKHFKILYVILITLDLSCFFSFDYCHAVKNARNLFLDHDLASSEGMISASYLKEFKKI